MNVVLWDHLHSAALLCVVMTTHISHGEPPGGCHNVICSDVKALLGVKPVLQKKAIPLCNSGHLLHNKRFMECYVNSNEAPDCAIRTEIMQLNT